MVGKREEDSLSRSDLDAIIEVNKKAIELQVEVAAQNEMFIEDLEESKQISENIKRDTESTLREIALLKLDVKDSKKDTLDKLKDIEKKVDELDKSQFKIYALLTTGTIAVILQIVQIILNLKK